MPRDLLAPRDLLEGYKNPSDTISEGGIVSGAENIRMLSLREKILNDARILRDAAFGGVRGGVQGVTDVGGIVANPVGVVANAALPGDPFSTNVSQDISDTMTAAGLPEPQTQAGRGAQDLARAATAQYAGQAATARIFPQTMTQPRQPSPRQQVLREGQREGLVAPPAAVGSSRTASLLEGWAGTRSTRQLANVRNQARVNQLAARALGLSDDTVTPQAIAQIRQEAGQAYDVIRGSGKINADSTFKAAIADAVKKIRNAASQSSNLGKVAKDVLGTADDLASRDSYDANTVVDLMDFLRSNANSAYKAGMSAQGKAYRAMSNAFEDAVERTLSGRGEAGRAVLDAFRNARTLLAKTHTVEDALSGSNTAAAALSRMVSKGKPLTDELSLIGRFAQEFPKGMQLQQTSGATPMYSPLDYFTGAASLGAAGVAMDPLLALPALYAASRPAIRSFLLSPTGQRMLRESPNAINPQVIGLIGGGLAVPQEH